MNKGLVRKITAWLAIFAVMVSMLGITIVPTEVRAAEGNTYYVSSTDGDDANDGLTEKAPWKTLEKVSSSTFQPGDKIFFKAGDVWNGTLKLKNISGTEAAPIVIDKYGSTDPSIRPIFNGNGTTSKEVFGIYSYYAGVTDKTHSATIDIIEGNYLEINNLEVTNYNENVVSQRAGIAIKDSTTSQAEWTATPQKHIYIKNCYVHDVNSDPKGQKSGTGGIIFLGNISDVLVEDCKVVNVDVEGIRNAGLYKEGDITANFPKNLQNIVFRNNYIEKVQGDGMVISNVGQKGIMEYNTVVEHSYKNVGNVNYAGLWVMACKDTVAQYNEVYGGLYGYNDGEAFDIDMFCEGVLYQYNYSHSNKGGFSLFMNGSTNSVFRYNLSVNDGNGTEIFHYLPNSTNYAPLIHNNTIFVDNNISTRMFNQDSSSTVYVKFYNNLVMAKGDFSVFSSKPVYGELKNNCFYPQAIIQGQDFSHATLANNIFTSPKLARPGEEPKGIIKSSNSFSVNALDAYKLMSDSPCIDNGMDVSALTPSVWTNATKDLFNNNLTGTVDIGAHEFSNDQPENTRPEILPASIILDKSDLQLYAGYSDTVTATLLPAEAWIKGMKWSSSNPAVAIVNSNGFISGITPGTAVITAESVVDPSVKAICNVTVNEVKAIKDYFISSNVSKLDPVNNTTDLKIFGQMEDGNTLENAPFYKVNYTTDNPGATADSSTGKLTLTGDMSGASEITVSANVEEYKDLVYSESFEAGWRDFVPEAGGTTIGAKISNKISYHGEYSALYEAQPAIEKVFAPNQNGIVSMMLYDDGTKKGATRVVAHVGNLRTTLLCAMGVFFDGGSVGNLDNYSVRVSSTSSAWEKTNIPRTVGWHELKWDYTSGTDVKMYIDNQLVKTSTAIKAFDRINLAFVWDSANGRTFGFDNIKYASTNEKVYKNAELKIPVERIQGIEVNSENNVSKIDKSGGTLQMSAKVTPDNYKDSIVWSVIGIDGKPTTSATIDSNGLLKATGNGAVKVLATAKYDSTVKGEKVITITNQVLATTITTNGYIGTGEQLAVKLGLTGVGESVYSQVYTEDITIIFDTNLFDFVSAEGADDKTVVTAVYDETPGVLRILATNKNGITVGSAQILNLTFKAKNLQTTSVGNIIVSKAELQIMPDANYISAQPVQVAITVKGLDKSVLTAAIATAQNIYNSSVEGLNPGQYSSASRTALKTALDLAQAVVDNENDLNQAKINEAVTMLNKAIDTFKASIISSTGDGDTDTKTPTPTPTPTPIPTPTPENGKIIVKPVAENGEAVVNITKEQIAAAVDTAKINSNGAKEVNIEVGKVENVSSYVQKLPIPVVSTKSIEVQYNIETPLGKITVPSNMLNNSGITDEKLLVQIIVEKSSNAGTDSKVNSMIGNRPVIELSVMAGDKLIEWNNTMAPVTVALDYTPTSEELNKLGQIVVLYIDDNGKAVAMQNSRYDASSKKVIFTTTHFSKYAVAFVQKSFKDMVGYEWANNAVESMASRGIINGTSETTFEPGSDITRSDFMLLLIKSLGLTAEVGDNFVDVSKDAYYYEAIGIAKKLGIAKGDENSKFNPYEKLSRQDMMVLTARAMNIAGKKLTIGSQADIEKYQDKGDIASYANESVATLIKNGIIIGDGNTIRPLDNVSRAETAVMLYRIYNK